MACSSSAASTSRRRRTTSNQCFPPPQWNWRGTSLGAFAAHWRCRFAPDSVGGGSGKCPSWTSRATHGCFSRNRILHASSQQDGNTHLPKGWGTTDAVSTAAHLTPGMSAAVAQFVGNQNGRVGPICFRLCTPKNSNAVCLCGCSLMPDGAVHAHGPLCLRTHGKWSRDGRGPGNCQTLRHRTELTCAEGFTTHNASRVVS